LIQRPTFCPLGWPPGAGKEPHQARRIASAQDRSTGGEDMGWILIIIVGGILGWLASKVMRTDAEQGILLNIVVGIVGAALAGFLISPLLGIPTINAANFSIGGLLISFLGALILLAIVNLIRRGRAR
jgi:uncharacterized membrane protein YeaQ/YmgE (transglycosylase-associated protein family)